MGNLGKEMSNFVFSFSFNDSSIFSKTKLLVGS